LGDFEKSEVRRIAARHGLPVADKPDSNEICFVPNNDYRSFLAERLPSAPGPLVDVSTGDVVGVHSGYTGYTVGQRKGLGALGARRFVTGIHAESNVVFIGDDDALRCRTAVAERLRWVAGCPPPDGTRVDAKIRYKSRPAPASLEMAGETLHVRFDEPQRAITPGQAVVFYDGEVVLGGGTIERSVP
jgi:tRNA-specific 2-thiouridylase